jgi:hypothetical protein
MRLVWPNMAVEEGNLARNTSTLRTALGEKRRELRAGFRQHGADAARCSVWQASRASARRLWLKTSLADLAAEERSTVARGRCSERLAGTEAYLPLLERLPLVV